MPKSIKNLIASKHPGTHASNNYSQLYIIVNFCERNLFINFYFTNFSLLRLYTSITGISYISFVIFFFNKSILYPILDLLGSDPINDWVEGRRDGYIELS